MNFDFFAWLKSFYWWTWFHLEFWIANKLERRPFTFMMRDFIYAHSNITIIFVFLWVAFMFYWGNRWAIGLSWFTGMLLAHLVWGEQWIKGQQEDPPYVGDNEDGFHPPEIQS
jgi:hypothetical protein